MSKCLWPERVPFRGKGTQILMPENQLRTKSMIFLQYSTETDREGAGEREMLEDFSDRQVKGARGRERGGERGGE